MKTQLKKIPVTNSVNENVFYNKNIKTLNQFNINFIAQSKIKNIIETSKKFNQNEMNKIDFKTFKRKVFVDYSSISPILKNQVTKEKNENNKNLNINNKINDLEMKGKKLGRKKKRTEENTLQKEVKEYLVTCNNGIIKILEDDSNTFPSSNEIKLNFEVIYFL